MKLFKYLTNTPFHPQWYAFFAIVAVQLGIVWFLIRPPS